VWKRLHQDRDDLERLLDSAHEDARTERTRTDLNEQRLRLHSVELAADNAELEANNAELEAHKVELEADKVELEADKVELEADKVELESFGYSVSHDLHSPVCAMLGFTRTLQERCAHLLDDEGRRLLDIVQNEAIRMGNLIDDLLLFSQIGSGPLADAAVDMTRLAREVASEQAALLRSPVEIGQLPSIRGDAVLLRQVWINLIANAVKYSSKEHDARIVVSATSEPQRVVYCVRDNGVGFDMRNVGELFGVFRRLHRTDEFPGTGVGLAIVKRIVERHGGTVWADARLGEGAAFSFALPADG
jgi:light-regulated signal transduction histidine kinase (bacteriophytochrome)